MVSLIFVSGLASGFMVPINHHGEAMKESVLKGGSNGEFVNFGFDEGFQRQADRQQLEVDSDEGGFDNKMWIDNTNRYHASEGSGPYGSGDEFSGYSSGGSGANSPRMNRILPPDSESDDESELELHELREQGVQLQHPRSGIKDVILKIKRSFHKENNGALAPGENTTDENVTNEVPGGYMEPNQYASKPVKYLVDEPARNNSDLKNLYKDVFCRDNKTKCHEYWFRQACEKTCTDYKREQIQIGLDADKYEPYKMRKESDEKNAQDEHLAQLLESLRKSELSEKVE